MNKYQGESIGCSIEITKTSNNITSFEDIKEMVVYFYTNTSFISKFSTKAKNGYNKFNISGTKATAIIPTADTKKMLGPLLIDIMIIDNQGQNVNIKSRKTGINIEYTPISAETK